MNITQVGIDLAKLVFQVHGVDARGKVALRKQLKRHQVVAFFAQMPPCLVGMEACGGAHFWARKLAELGHTVKLIAPHKNTEQQALLGLHRARKGFVTERTAQANQIRGLLTEFGLVIPVGIRSIGRKLPEFLEDAENGLSAASRALFARLFEHFRALDRQVEELEREINAWHREDTASQRLATGGVHVCRYFLSVILAPDTAFPKPVKHLLFAVSKGVLSRSSVGIT
jgi:transposase